MNEERTLLIHKVTKEKDDLDEKITRLKSALNNIEILDMIDPPHIPLLKIQYQAMLTYSQILGERLELLKPE
jgi:hypothetical protein